MNQKLQKKKLLKKLIILKIKNKLKNYNNKIKHFKINYYNKKNNKQHKNQI